MKKLKEIIGGDSDLEILGITDDSREVQNGYLFVATKGFNVDHYDYIEDALKNGCSFVIADRKVNEKIPYLIVNNINDYFIKCCEKFYDIDLTDYRFIGITGTDGKTTTSTIVRELISDASYIGTNGLTIVDKNFSTNNTTPCISELYNDLKLIKENNCHNVVMEVSSEALLHERVKNFKFSIIGFTNITGDHLNVHGSFENYVNCKLKLLDLLDSNGYVVVNGDDVNLQKIKCQNLSTFGFDEGNDYLICHVKYLSNFVEIGVKFEDKEWVIKSPLKGKHNVYNVVMSFVIGRLYGISDAILLDRIEKLGVIAGRCEMLDFGQNYSIILDYAHTINGISSILDTFKGCGKIITVTGCAGGREKEKRNTIGNLVMDKSDVAIFTMDDPRYENVDEIIDQMVGNRKDYVRIIDRAKAIKYALDIASSGDIVLILGKGRDNYMAIEDRRIYYSDYDVVQEVFKEKLM